MPATNWFTNTELWGGFLSWKSSGAEGSGRSSRPNCPRTSSGTVTPWPHGLSNPTDPPCACTQTVAVRRRRVLISLYTTSTSKPSISRDTAISLPLGYNSLEEITVSADLLDTTVWKRYHYQLISWIQ